MCLITEQLVPKRTRKDKIVYKILMHSSATTENPISPFRYFLYTPRKLYSIQKLTPEKMEGSSFYRIDEGFHAYTTKQTARKALPEGIFRTITWHCYECIIPKDSEYYLSVKEIDEIVSNQIIINKIIE